MKHWMINLRGSVLALADARKRLDSDTFLEDFDAELDFLEDYYDPNQAQVADLRLQLGFDEEQSRLLEKTLAKAGKAVSRWSHRSQGDSLEWIRNMVESDDWSSIEALAAAMIRLWPEEVKPPGNELSSAQEE